MTNSRRNSQVEKPEDAAQVSAAAGDVQAKPAGGVQDNSASDKEDSTSSGGSTPKSRASSKEDGSPAAASAGVEDSSNLKPLKADAATKVKAFTEARTARNILEKAVKQAEAQHEKTGSAYKATASEDNLASFTAARKALLALKTEHQQKLTSYLEVSEAAAKAQEAAYGDNWSALSKSYSWSPESIRESAAKSTKVLETVSHEIKTLSLTPFAESKFVEIQKLLKTLNGSPKQNEFAKKLSSVENANALKKLTTSITMEVKLMETNAQSSSPEAASAAAGSPAAQQSISTKNIIAKLELVEPELRKTILELAAKEVRMDKDSTPLALSSKVSELVRIINSIERSAKTLAVQTTSEDAKGRPSAILAQVASEHSASPQANIEPVEASPELRDLVKAAEDSISSESMALIVRNTDQALVPSSSAGVVSKLYTGVQTVGKVVTTAFSLTYNSKEVRGAMADAAIDSAAAMTGGTVAVIAPTLKHAVNARIQGKNVLAAVLGANVPVLAKTLAAQITVDSKDTEAMTKSVELALQTFTASLEKGEVQGLEAAKAQAIKIAAIAALKQGLEGAVAENYKTNPLATKLIAGFCDMVSRQAVAVGSVAITAVAQQTIEHVGGASAAADSNALLVSSTGEATSAQGELPAEAKMLADLMSSLAIGASQELSGSLQSGDGLGEASSMALTRASEKTVDKMSATAPKLAELALQAVAPSAVALVTARVGAEAGQLAQDSIAATSNALQQIGRGESVSQAVEGAGKVVATQTALAGLRSTMSQAVTKKVISQEAADGLLSTMGEGAVQAANFDASIAAIFQNMAVAGGADVVGKLMDAGILGAEAGAGLLSQLEKCQPDPVKVKLSVDPATAAVDVSFLFWGATLQAQPASAEVSLQGDAEVSNPLSALVLHSSAAPSDASAAAAAPVVIGGATLEVINSDSDA